MLSQVLWEGAGYLCLMHLQPGFCSTVRSICLRSVLFSFCSVKNPQPWLVALLGSFIHHLRHSLRDFADNYIDGEQARGFHGHHNWSALAWWVFLANNLHCLPLITVASPALVTPCSHRGRRQKEMLEKVRGWPKCKVCRRKINSTEVVNKKEWHSELTQS